MKIKSFYTTSPIFDGGRFDECKSICVFAAPAVFLHMMRCLWDGESDNTPIDESKERTFVSEVKVDLDGEDIDLCGVLCDDQSFFVAVKDGEHFSAEQTQKVIAKLRSMKRDERNSYNFLNKYVANENNLSECDYNIANFNRFIEIVKEETAKGDIRPIYIFNFFVANHNDIADHFCVNNGVCCKFSNLKSVKSIDEVFTRTDNAFVFNEHNR